MRASTVAILGLAACAQGFQLTPVSVHPATRTTGVSLAAERDPNSPPARGLSRKDYANTGEMVICLGGTSVALEPSHPCCGDMDNQTQLSC